MELKRNIGFKKKKERKKETCKNMHTKLYKHELCDVLLNNNKVHATILGVIIIIVRNKLLRTLLCIWYTAKNNKIFILGSIRLAPTHYLWI